MKKVLSLSGIALSVLAICSLFVVSCNKENEQTKTPKPESSALKEQEKPIKTFAELDAKVNIEEGILKFETEKDLIRTVNFLTNANTAEIVKWEKSLNDFTSVYNYYLQANSIETKDTTYEGYNKLKQSFKGKVKFTDDGIEPLINNGNVFGRITNSDGFYKIGKNIVSYFSNKVISADNMDKIKKAHMTLVTDSAMNIYVHDLVLNKNSNPNLSTRNFDPVCSACPFSSLQDRIFDRDGDRYKIIAEYQFLDNSSGFPNFFKAYSVNLAMRFRRRKAFNIYGATQNYGGVSWVFRGIGYSGSAIPDALGNICSFGPQSFDINDSGNRSNGVYDNNIPIFINESPTPFSQFTLCNSFYSELGFPSQSCVYKTSLEAFPAQLPSINTSFKCGL